MDLKESDILKDHIFEHWYYKIKSESLQKTLGGQHFDSVSDIGAGGGFFSKVLLDAGVANKAHCIDIGYPQERSETWNGKKIEFLRSMSHLPEGLVMLMDVLEHVEDDVTLLRNYTQIAPKGSKFFITVPAFQFLFSEHDVFLEHYRRYTLNQIESVVENSGLTIIKSHYLYGTLFPAIACIRLLKRLMTGFRPPTNPKTEMKIHSKFMNAIYYWIHKLELQIQNFNKFYGLTAVVFAEKK